MKGAVKALPLCSPKAFTCNHHQKSILVVKSDVAWTTTEQLLIGGGQNRLLAGWRLRQSQLTGENSHLSPLLIGGRVMVAPRQSAPTGENRCLADCASPNQSKPAKDMAAALLPATSRQQRESAVDLLRT